VESHRIVLVTGLSGAGKSTATKALEDLGYFCIDNLPVMLLPKLLELVSHGTSDEVQRLAIVVDAREARFLEKTPAALDEVRREGHQLEVVFFDCADDALMRRFSETRRRHPLSPDGSVQDGIAEERRLLQTLRGLADQIIDTTRLLFGEAVALVLWWSRRRRLLRTSLRADSRRRSPEQAFFRPLKLPAFRLSAPPVYRSWEPPLCCLGARGSHRTWALPLLAPPMYPELPASEGQAAVRSVPRCRLERQGECQPKRLLR